MNRAPLSAAVAFIDLAGFTALTETHGDLYAADVFQTFVEAMQTTCTLQGAALECVKHLGDGVLLIADSPGLMVEALLQGIASRADGDVPLRVRAGVHSGDLLKIQTVHGVDYIGRTVNLAARLCGLAGPGELLMSEAVRASVPHLAYRSAPLGRRALRNVRDPVTVWSLPFGTSDPDIDPVCHMTVRVNDVSVVRGGREWRFCSLSCRDTFLRESDGAS